MPVLLSLLFVLVPADADGRRMGTYSSDESASSSLLSLSSSLLLLLLLLPVLRLLVPGFALRTLAVVSVSAAAFNRAGVTFSAQAAAAAVAESSSLAFAAADVRADPSRSARLRLRERRLRLPRLLPLPLLFLEDRATGDGESAQRSSPSREAAHRSAMLVPLVPFFL